jgi:hypothetical protein
MSNIPGRLATAIEETLIVYHEPMLVRWACRVLAGSTDTELAYQLLAEIEDFAKEKAGGKIPHSKYLSNAQQAARHCLLATICTNKEVYISVAIEAALQAQDEQHKTKKYQTVFGRKIGHE